MQSGTPRDVVAHRQLRLGHRSAQLLGLVVCAPQAVCV